MKVLTLILVLGLAQAQAADRRYTRDPDVMLTWKLRVENNILANKIFSDIADATVSNATLYADDEVGWMFGSLAAKINVLSASSYTSGDTTVNYLGNSVYEYYETFATDRTEWEIDFPPGKGIKSVGLVFIGGFPFNSLGEIVYGPGAIQTGIKYEVVTPWIKNTFAIAHFILHDIAPIVFPEEADLQIRIPSTLSSERLGLLEY